MVVDLPDPFGPRNPVTRPGSTTNERSSTTVRLPYRLVTCSNSSGRAVRADDAVSVGGASSSVSVISSSSG